MLLLLDKQSILDFDLCNIYIHIILINIHGILGERKQKHTIIKLIVGSAVVFCLTT